MNSFETLLDIEHNCRANAVSIPRQIVTERDWIGVGFRASNFNFVCPMDLISEILRWPTMAKLPSSASWFKGIANLRGRLLPVTDFQGFVTGTRHKQEPTSRILVVNIDNAHYGFAVEQVLGIERFFSEEAKVSEEISDIGEYLAYSKKAFERDSEPWIVVDFESLIEEAKFYHILSAKMEI